MKKILLLLILSLVFISCTKSGSDDDSNRGDNNNDNTRSFTTNCGVVFNGRLELPISASRGTVGQASVISGNQIIFTTAEGSILVKLQGIGEASPLLNNSAANELRSLTDREVLFFPANGSCSTTVAGGGQAQVGQIFTANGRSFSEELIENGLAVINPGDVCGGELIGACYTALLESSAPTERVSEFLWKPVAERDGNLVVLLNPRNATVIVNGVTLNDTGPSNGRGTTARANRSGASFGSNITVQAFDALGRALIFPNGQTSYIIANGASRVELP